MKGRRTLVRRGDVPPARFMVMLDRIHGLCCRHDRLGPRMKLTDICACVLQLKKTGEVVMCPLVHRLMGFEEAA